ncbi:MAG: alpha/beta fold hydrolase [Gammaproteobacteria bacterium]
MNILPSRQPLEAEGERPTVIGLHAGAGAPEQWRPLAERLRFRYRVLAPQLRGYAASRALGTGEPISLDAEAALIEPLLDAFPGPVYLVGHGYGAAVALKLALARRERIRGLVLYEPTPFSLLLADAKSRCAYMDIEVLRRVLGRHLDVGDWFRAALRYVDHFSGAGVWQGLSVQERATIAHRMPALCAQLAAQLADPTPASAYAGIDVPVLLLSGARPRACTRRIAQLLARTLPRAEWRQLDGVGHGPGAHPEEVDREIEDFLARHPLVSYRDPRSRQRPSRRSYLRAAAEGTG